MDVKERIVYSNEQMMFSLESALNKMHIFQYDEQYRRLLGDSFADKMSDWEDKIRQRKNDPFTIVIIGDFKRGKSTLINALLGEEVVTSDVTTETVTMNRISYGIHGNEAVLANNRRARLTDSELKREELEKVLSDLNEPVIQLELKRDCEFLKKVTVIDTPGTGDAMKDFSDVVKVSLLQADAVIYVYNVRYPLSQSEQMFLRSTVIPQEYTTLFLVGNYADTLENEEQYKRMRELLERRVENLLPGAEVFMVSALDELCKALGRERISGTIAPILDEQFLKLRMQLNNLIDEKAESVVLDRMQRLTSAMLHDLSSELDTIETGLEMDEKAAVAAMDKLRLEKSESVEKMNALSGRLDAQVSSFKSETQRWMDEFLTRIIDETKNLSGETSDTLRKYYEFYCIDLLQQALMTCIEYHRELLYDCLDEISSELSKKLASEIPEKTDYKFRFHLDNRIWTKGDTVGLAVSMLPFSGFLGTVASLAADGISGIMREGEAQVRTPELLRQISSKLTGLTLSVNEAVEKIYSDMGENAKKLISEYYEEELENKEHALNQAISVSAKEEDEKARLKEIVVKAREILKNVHLT